jgi:hypothetical protein
MNLKSLFPHASKSTLALNGQLQSPVPERDETPALGGSVQGKKGSPNRTVVRFIGFRVRPLDPDNFAGGCKDLLDGLRHAQLLHGDEPWRIDFQTRQEKVSHRNEEKTIIEIEY